MTRSLVTAAVLVLALGVGRTEAATIAFDNTSPVTIPGLTGFETDGGDMAGLVPEPATLTLLGIGLAGLDRARRRSTNGRGAA